MLAASMASPSPFVVKVPNLLEPVTRQAESLPWCAPQPLLLVRLAMLLQDAVEAACMCARAHIDAPQLAKHLLSSETYQAFQAASKDDSGGDLQLDVHAAAFAAAVVGVVGEVS